MSLNKFRFTTSLLTIALSLGFVSVGFCQDGGNGDGDPPSDQLGGVKIDTDGVFQSKLFVDLSGDLDRQRLMAAQTKLNKNIQAPSKLRKISLNRLEVAAKKLKQAGKPIPPEMQYLAGMTRLTHVFYYPETKDIVIAGPAEGFFRSSQDRIIGMKSGRAVLQLQDLIVALRAYAPGSNPTRVISCSIDPTQQGLANFHQAVLIAQKQIVATQGQGISESDITNYFQDAMGMHKVTVQGVSPKTHFAQVLVDADYHMKLIGIGLEQPPVRITSFIEKAKPGSGKNSLQRWFFRPNYDYLRVSADETALHLDGGGVELVGENEIVSANGQRQATGKSSRASRTFCSSFTKMYDALSERMPIYAELRNVIDLSVAAAFIHEMDFYGEADWKMDFFGSESKYPVERFNAPKKVAPAINAVWKSNQLMTPIGGGVNIQPRVALNAENMKTDESGNIEKTKKSIDMSDVKSDQWWWD